MVKIVSKLRLFTLEQLKGRSLSSLTVTLDGVMTSDELTEEEKRLNIEILEFAISGGMSKARNEAILADIKAGEADISDIQ